MDNMKRFENDENFIVYSAKKDNYDFHSYKEFTLEGYPFYSENQSFFRLPSRIFEQIPQTLINISRNSGGGLIRFRTNTKKMAVYAEYTEKYESSLMSQMVDAGFDLYKLMEGQYYSVANFRPMLGEEVCDMELTVSDDDNMYDYLLYLPLFSWVKDFSVGVEKGCNIEMGSQRNNTKKILCYGSSVTHGACASRPGLTYPAMLGRMLDCETYNLGFSGNCKGEECIARELAALDFDAMVMEYAHNAPSKEHLKATHEPFYKIIRESHPDVPIIFITMPEFESKSTQIEAGYKEIVKETYKKAINNGDNNVYYLDGRELFPDFMRSDYSSADKCHPNDLGMLEIARKIYDILV